MAVYGYNGKFPGDTFVTEQFKPIIVEWVNKLPNDHIFLVRSQGAAFDAAPLLTRRCAGRPVHPAHAGQRRAGQRAAEPSAGHERGDCGA
jgi:hypothetical protein